MSILRIGRGVETAGIVEIIGIAETIGTGSIETGNIMIESIMILGTIIDDER